ncbi:coiled-coil domain-containing protein 121-like [Apodemus sylvaticus]|uniref:coiled-coil domain-containing protein 121-like n=1 Tax=Apodemus sylvaticus TaxID=10129 RepID=UPI00224307A3|nr:coiled-coil domain-containing protein 121-like [Apodemus sylvaticus]
METQGSRRGTLYPQRQEGGATLLPHRQEGGAVGPPLLPAKDEPVRIREDFSYRAFLTRKKALHDFRVRWPELILLDQKKKEELPLIGQSSSDLFHAPSSCSSMVSITSTDLETTPSELLDPTAGFAADSKAPPSQSPQMIILNSYMNPESLTRLEKKVRRKTLEAMTELEQEMEAVKRRRSVLIKDVKDMQMAISYEKADNKPFLEYLRQKNEEKQRKYDALWKDYNQQCLEIEDRRLELISAFTSHTEDLQKQLMRNRKLEASLKKKLKALEPIAQVRESQEQTIQALELEEASIAPDFSLMDREAHLQFLKERAALEKQMEDLNLLESGEKITRKLKKKAKALDTAARQAHEKFWEGIKAENRQLQTQLQHLDQEFLKLEAGKEKLERRKQRWKEQQWYLEALARGRERLQQQEHRQQQQQEHRQQQQEHHQQQQEHRQQQQEHRQQQQEHYQPKPQTAPQPALGRLLSARPKASPK